MPPDQALSQNAQRSQKSGAASAEEGRAKYAQDQQSANDAVLRDVQGRGGGDVVQKKTGGKASAVDGNAAAGPMNSDMAPHKQGPVAGDVSPAAAAEFGSDVATHASSDPVQKKKKSAVQAKSVGGGGEKEQEKAAKGLRGQAEKLPYKDQIQKAFGRHKLDGIEVYKDKGAKDAAKEIGAKAYAMGSKIAFGGSPDLHTAAHEAAHVVQQRAGIKGGAKWEKHADEVADAVVQGQSAEPLLDEISGGGNSDKHFGSGEGAVQKKASDVASEHLGAGYFKGENSKASLGASMESAAQVEDTADQAAFPKIEEKMGPDSEETAPDEQLETPADAGAPADGVEGADPTDPDLPETQNLDAPAQPNAPNLPTGEDADIEAMKRDFGGSLRSMPTSLDGLETSPGPSPEVALSGASDPERSQRQEADALGTSDNALAEAAAAVDNGPGPEQVQPRAVSESHDVEIPEVPVLDGMDDIEKAVEFNGMSKVTAEIKNKTDEVGQAQLASTVAEAQGELDKASSDRMSSRDAEISNAETENKKLIDDANSEQNAEIDKARADIDGQRSETKRKQQSEVDNIKSQSEREKAKVNRDIDAEVAKSNKSVDDKFKATEQEASQAQSEAEREAERKKREAEREAENDSWWSRAVSAISSAFDALADAITGLLDGLMAAVTALVDAAKDFANSVIDACVSFVSAALEAYGDLLKGLVDGLLGDLFPGLAAALCEFIDAAVDLALAAVNFIAEKLKEGINALLDAIAGALNAIIAAYKAAITAALALAKAVLTGDWEALGRMILEGVLQLAGIPPADFYNLMGAAMGAIDTIIEDPGAFVGNVIDAAAGGMSQFGDNILSHLTNGFFEWIVGPIGEMGITLPSSWDLAGIFGLAAQVLGLTQDGIRGVIEEELGEGAGVVFDYIWRYVGALITGGIEGLWEEVQNDLSSLYDMVIDGIKSWLIETIVTQAIMRLATMFNPVGALLNAIITIWNVYTFLRDQIARIWGVVTSVVNTIAEIAAGNTQPAKDGVENALASLIPIAIDFLAKLLGIDGITEKVREIIEGIQETVHGAIRSLIQRVKGMFQGGENTTEEDTPEFGESTFSAGTGDGGASEGHRVYVEAGATDVTVLVASGTPMAPAAQVQNGGEFEAMDGDQESNVVTLGRDAERLSDEAKADGDQSKADQATAKLEQIKLIMQNYAGERTLEAMCPAVGGSAQTKYNQLQEARGEGLGSLVDTFTTNCDAALDANHGLTPLQSMKDEGSSNSSNYILKGPSIPASEYSNEGGVSRLLDLPSVWGYYIGGDKDEFENADHMIWAAANGHYDPCAHLAGEIRGAAAEGWWFRADQASGMDVGELKEQLSVNDAAYNKGVIRLNFSPADMGHVGMDLKKPTILDAVAQGDERDPMWASASGKTWGVTGGGVLEGVAPPVSAAAATAKILIQGQVPDPPGVVFEPMEAVASLEGGTETLKVEKEGDKDVKITLDGADPEVQIMAAKQFLQQAGNTAGADVMDRMEQAVSAIADAADPIKIKYGLIKQEEHDELTNLLNLAKLAMEAFGTIFKLPNLERAVRQEEMAQVGPIQFPYKTTPNEDYNTKFAQEMERQLQDQEDGINTYTIDQWATQIQSFGLNPEYFEGLDDSCMAAAGENLKSKVDEFVNYMEGRARTAAESRGGDGDAAQMTASQSRRASAGAEHAEGVAAAAESGSLEQESGSSKRSRSTASGRAMGESDQRASAPRDNREGLQQLMDRETGEGGDWEGLLTSVKDLALLHIPDQVAGGHGIIQSIAHLRVPGENATEDEVTAYLDTLKTYFGSRAVNGRIGTLWPGRIREAYDLVVRDPRYPEQSHHLWKVNIKLDAIAE